MGGVYNCNLGHKFRYLYVTDSAGGFRDQATRLLSLCYQNAHTADDAQVGTYSQTLTKLLGEVEELYLGSSEQHK